MRSGAKCGVSMPPSPKRASALAREVKQEAAAHVPRTRGHNSSGYNVVIFHSPDLF